eukprot:jgi/Galph1/5991/GphlegSOOS_G4563.1
MKQKHSGPTVPMYETTPTTTFSSAAYEQLLEAIESMPLEKKVGDIVKGQVSCFTPDGLWLDLGLKETAFLPKEEIWLEKGKKLQDVYSVGSFVEVEVISPRKKHKLYVSQKRVKLHRYWDLLEDLHEKGQSFEVASGGMKNNGISVYFDCVEGYLPVDHVLPDIPLDNMLHTNLRVKILDLSRKRKLVVSQRLVVAESRDKQLKVGDIVEGWVRAVRSYGFVVDLQGVLGLLYIGDISRERVTDPGAVFQQELKVLRMSYDDIRKQLDLLLGPNRDGVEREAPPTSFKDRRVCKYFLCGVCPHLLFSNTKADVGPCDKVHDETLRKQYEQASKQGEYFGYEEELERFCKRLIAEVDRRIERAVKRLQVQYGVDNEKASELLAYYPGPGRTLLGIIDEEGKEDLEKGVGGLIGQTEHYYSEREEEEEEDQSANLATLNATKKGSIAVSGGIRVLAVDGSSVSNSASDFATGTNYPGSVQEDEKQENLKIQSNQVASKETNLTSSKFSETLTVPESDKVAAESVADKAGSGSVDSATMKDKETRSASKEGQHSDGLASTTDRSEEEKEVWKEAKAPDGRSYWYNVATRESRWQVPAGVKLIPLSTAHSVASEGSLNTATNESALSGDQSSSQQKLRVCAECGAFLSIFDSSRRLVDHFNGKMHLGFVTLRKKVTELEETRKQDREKRFRENRRSGMGSSGGRKNDEPYYDGKVSRYDDRRKRRRRSRSPDKERERHRSSHRHYSSDEDDHSRRSSYSHRHSRTSESSRQHVR